MRQNRLGFAKLTVCEFAILVLEFPPIITHSSFNSWSKVLLDQISWHISSVQEIKKKIIFPCTWSNDLKIAGHQTLPNAHFNTWKTHLKGALSTQVLQYFPSSWNIQIKVKEMDFKVCWNQYFRKAWGCCCEVIWSNSFAIFRQKAEPFKSQLSYLAT